MPATSSSDTPVLSCAFFALGERKSSAGSSVIFFTMKMSPPMPSSGVAICARRRRGRVARRCRVTPGNRSARHRHAHTRAMARINTRAKAHPREALDEGGGEVPLLVVDLHAHLDELGEEVRVVWEEEALLLARGEGDEDGALVGGVLDGLDLLAAEELPAVGGVGVGGVAGEVGGCGGDKMPAEGAEDSRQNSV